MKSSIVGMENPRSVAALERELVKEYPGIVLTIVFCQFVFAVSK
jgi:hypothetical protein